MTQPYIVSLKDDEEGDEAFADEFYPPTHSLPQLQDIYHEMQNRKGSKREVIDRILQGDWRHGLTLYQLAMADFQYLSDHPTSQKWMAHRILPLKTLDTTNPDEDVLRIDNKSLAIPRVHPSTFLERLQQQVLPDAKAHFQFDHRRSQPFVLLRIFVIDSPYNTDLALFARKKADAVSDFESSRTMYIAFPDGAPFLYVSKAQTLGATNATDTKSLRDLIFTGIRMALSRPRQRYTIMSTTLTSRNLATLLHVRGRGRANAAGGGWGVYAEDENPDTPLDLKVPRPPLLEVSSNRDMMDKATPTGHKRSRGPSSGTYRESKRARLVAKARFGPSGMVADRTGFERVDVTLTDTYPTQAGDAEDAEEWTPNIRLTFQGAHVFGGVRQLVERGVISGDRIPGWLTGEDNITVGTVKYGRIRGKKVSWL